jgi:hypothetical protein
MKLEWVDAEKSKVSALAGGRPAFTTWYQTNAHWYFWTATAFKSGDKAKLPFLPGEHDVRNDKGKVLLDPDGAGKGAEEQMKLPQKADIVSFKGRKYNDGTLGDVHVRMVEGPYQYKIMGQAARANREGGVVQFRWQGAMQATTKFDGLDIAIYDEDADGIRAVWILAAVALKVSSVVVYVTLLCVSERECAGSGRLCGDRLRFAECDVAGWWINSRGDCGVLQ